MAQLFLKNLLQGKPIGHPLHPVLVHLPIGLFILSFGFDVAWLLGEGQPWLVHATTYTIGVGIVGALLAAVPGLVDYLDIRRDHPAKRIATYHMILNLIAVGLYTGSFAIRYWIVRDELSAGAFTLSTLGIAVISASGYLGGLLVYENGIAVGGDRRWTPTPEYTHKPRAHRDDGYVVVASDDQIEDGGSLRVAVDGQVMVVVKLGGKIYAFQEFCTHRYGPLSEGQFKNETVMCPWHRSVFNMRTGKVVEGPAKTDLKTFDAKIEEGQILVKPPAA